MAPTVLTVGFAPSHPILTKSGVDPSAIKAGLDAMKAALEAEGYNFSTYLVTQTDLSAISQTWIEKLQEKKWDAVVIGFGLRGIASQTVTFETMVNLVREFAPQAKFAFNDKPETTLDALRRVVPV